MRHKKPVIALDADVKVSPKTHALYSYVHAGYYDRVLAAGGIPLMLPPLTKENELSALLDHVDAIVLTGGSDLDPKRMGLPRHPAVRPMVPRREDSIRLLGRLAIERRMPILGISLGMQLLNVIYGGTLHQDIQSEVKGARNHRSKTNPFHRVEVQPGSLCYKIFGRKSFLVHSSHHQAVKVPGRSLRITAFSEDGIPEAIEGPPRTIAVQWHPERSEKDPVQMRLFRYFLRLARSRLSDESQNSQ